MKLFHEIYGTYFRIVGQLLGQRKLTRKHVRSTVWQEGFSESVVYLEPKILPQEDNSDYGLLHQKDDDTLSPVTRHKPPHPITMLQKRWLRTKLDDPRMGLF
ncbi:MAG: WYL domain-containing protein, partial [Oscillospiraceae bacterium]|nr:WYL domain-containing protein [Oscillospiraceae bacterium]